MPQLDKFSFFPQFFTLLILLSVLYILSAFIVMPLIYRNIHVRNLVLTYFLGWFNLKNYSFFFLNKVLLSPSVHSGMVNSLFFTAQVLHMFTTPFEVASNLSVTWYNAGPLIKVSLIYAMYEVLVYHFFDRDEILRGWRLRKSLRFEYVFSYLKVLCVV